MASTGTKILLVEDEAIIALHEATLLGRHGFEVVRALSGPKAVEEADAQHFDLVLTDIDLGSEDTDGIATAAEIVARQDVPVVFLTGHAEKEFVERASEISSYGYVLKNTGEHVLVHSVNVALELFDTRRQLEAENTRRAEVEQALRDERAELSAVYEHTPVLMVLLDEALQVKKANATATRFGGHSAGGLSGTRMGEVLRCIHALDTPEGCGFGPACKQCTVRRTLLRTYERRSGYFGIEASVPIREGGVGRERFFVLSTVPLELQGRPHVVASLQDINAQKEKEQELERSEKRYHECYRRVPVMLHTVDSSNTIVEVNDYWLAELGYSRGEVLGRSSREFLAEGTGESQFVLFAKDGDARNVQLSVMSESNGSGGSGRFVIASKDGHS
jgi:CheY-like chemotaxis protein